MRRRPSCSCPAQGVAIRYLVTFVAGVQDTGKVTHVAQPDSRLTGKRRCACPIKYRAAAHEALTTGLGIGRVIVQAPRLFHIGVAQGAAVSNVVLHMLSQGHLFSPMAGQGWATSRSIRTSTRA